MSLYPRLDPLQNQKIQRTIFKSEPAGKEHHRPTNFHDLQLTLHFVVVAVLFEFLFEVINLGGLQCFALGNISKTLEDVCSPGPEPRGHNRRFSSSAPAPEYLLMSFAFPRPSRVSRILIPARKRGSQGH